MPLARYFSIVGSLLLALLLLADWYFPKLTAPPDRAGVDKTIIRLHSAHKWPEATVFDTSLPTIVPPPPAAVAEILPPASAARPAAQAFALALPETVPLQAASSPASRKHIQKRRARTAPAYARRIASDETGFRIMLPPAW